MWQQGNTNVQPDTVCFDALINAYGWAENEPGKALKCFEIYQSMLRMYKSGANRDAKPDIITCNSILNACAYEHVDSEEDRQAILKVVVQTLEDFQSSAPEFGWPNHITYANVLVAFASHMPAAGDRRDDLVEATFWQCCKSGNVSVLVINHLYQSLSWHRLSQLLGPALLSKEDEARIRFNARLLPREWTRYAPFPKERRESQPSKKSTAFSKTKRSSESMRRRHDDGFSSIS
jgi:hypothetical protein